MRIDTLKGLFKTTFSREFVDELARSTGAFVRFREIYPLPFVLSLLATVCTGPMRSIAGAHLAYHRLTGSSVSRSAFDAKVGSPEVASFLWQLFAQKLLASNRRARRSLPAPLRAFYDILIEDGTRMPVRKSLSDRLQSTTPGQAALKLLVRMSLAQGQVEDVRFAAAIHHDHKLLRGEVIAGALYLRDLGFYEHAEFARIADANAFFVSLLKSNAMPVVAKVYQGIRAFRAAEGVTLDGSLTYSRSVDVDAIFRLADGTQKTFRVVSLEVPVTNQHDKPTGERRRLWLVTNLDRKEWSVEAIAALYRLRYTCIERLFRSCKHIGKLDNLDTGRMAVVMVFVASSWLLQTLADRVVNALVKHLGFGQVSGDRVLLVLVDAWNDVMKWLYGGATQAKWELLAQRLRYFGRHPNPSQPKRIRQVVDTLEAQPAVSSDLGAVFA